MTLAEYNWCLALPWRTGSRVGRTIYAVGGPPGPDGGDPLIGTMDTPDLAREAVNAHNSQLERSA